MKSLKIIALLATLAALTGCSGACKGIGQAPGAFSGSAGWTGIANIGITGIQAGICGAGVMLDRAKQGGAEAVDGGEKKETMAERDLREHMQRLKEKGE